MGDRLVCDDDLALASTRPIRFPRASRPASTASSPRTRSRRRKKPAIARSGCRSTSGRSSTIAPAGITSIVWCIGFRTDYSWIDLPVFNGRGQPSHVRGVTPVPGVYFPRAAVALHLGLGPVFRRRRDAEYLAEHIKRRLGLAPADSQGAGQRSRYRILGAAYHRPDRSNQPARGKAECPYGHNVAV